MKREISHGAKKIRFVERKITEKRTQDFAYNKERADLEDNLTPAMTDAEREIEKYFTKQTAGMGYASGPMERVDNGNREEVEYSQFDLDRFKDLKDWKEACPSRQRGVVLDHVVFAFDFDQIAYQRCMSKIGVSIAYRHGLNEYCIIRGWGEQINI